MQETSCAPYKRKSLYWMLTIPMILVYVVIAVLLWRVKVVFFAVYVGLFVLVAFAMSYVCVYWRCPYVGRFAPCAGGFCLPASRIATLFRGAKRSEGRYKAFLSLAYVGFFGIILFPVYFLYVENVVFLVGYVGIAVVYGVLFMLYICPVCATRHVCPGGQTAVQMREALQALKRRGSPS